MTSTVISATVQTAIPMIYQGLIEDNPWKPLLSHLRACSGSEVAAVTLRQGDASCPPLVVWDRRSRLSRGQITRAQRDHAALAEADPLGNALKQSGDIYTLDEVVSFDELVDTPYHSRLMAPYGIRFQVGMCFEARDGWRCTIGLMRTADQPDFKEEDKALLTSLLPHLEQALGIYAQLQRQRAEYQIFRESLARLGVGAVVVDRHQRVMDSNPAAIHLIDRHNGIRLVRQRLSLTRDRSELEGVLAEAIKASETAPAQPFLKAIKLPSAAGFQGELTLLVRSVNALPQYCHSGSVPRAVIYLSDYLQDNIVSEETIQALFGLTRTEAILALLLCNGYTLAEAAEKLDVAPDTTRAYSKRIFAKVGVSRQAELVRILLKSVAFLA